MLAWALFHTFTPSFPKLYIIFLHFFFCSSLLRFLSPSQNDPVFLFLPRTYLLILSVCSWTFFSQSSWSSTFPHFCFPFLQSSWNVFLFFLFISVVEPEPKPRAEVKLPPGAEAQIKNCGSGSGSGSSSGSFLFISDLKQFYRKNHGRKRSFCVNCYNFNPNSQVNKSVFQDIF